MARYRFKETSASSEDEGWRELLASAYAAKDHPACLCIAGPSGPPRMYIARFNENHVVKRMPNTGSRHAPNCEHYEPPPELSGLGQILGSAVREDPEHETVSLALDFSLTKAAARAAPTFGEVEHESVRTDGTKLTLRATLHYLYDQAALTRWVPRMQGRRSWAVVRRELLLAAANKTSKGKSLTELLFVAESFSAEGETDIRARRAHDLARLASSPGNRMIIVAPWKRLDHSRYGFKLVLKHLPDMPLHLNDDIHKRVTQRFADQLALWKHFEESQLLMIGTISQPQLGIFNLESACLMNVTDAWIPFDSFAEYQLIDRMVRGGRRFTKGLRYNLPSTKPLAAAILQDTSPKPTALYLIAPGGTEASEHALRSLVEASDLQAWQWRLGEGDAPALPARSPEGLAGRRERAEVANAPATRSG